MWGFWSHPVSGLTQETSPESGSGPRGSAKTARPRAPLVGTHKIGAARRARTESATNGRAGAKTGPALPTPDCRCKADKTHAGSCGGSRGIWDSVGDLGAWRDVGVVAARR